MIKILKPDFVFNDDRGMLCQLVHEGYKQVNVVRSVAGAARGGHYHALNNEAFYILKGKVTVVAVSESEKEEYTFASGDMFEIARGVVHYFDFLEETFLVSFYDVGVELPDGTKDIIPA